MSELTKCNYCTLQEIKQRNPGKEVEVRESGEYKICDLQVFVDGVGIGVWFAALTDKCCC